MEQDFVVVAETMFCQILLHEAEILSTKSGYLDRLKTEATEVDLHHNNINREDGLILSTSWKSITGLLKITAAHRPRFSILPKHMLQYPQFTPQLPLLHPVLFSSLATLHQLNWLLPHPTTFNTLRFPKSLPEPIISYFTSPSS
jgi:hypothetical protein